MARNDTFFLRSNIVSTGTTYVSDEIDISAYTDPARGRVLVVDRGFITVDSDSAAGTGGPLIPADIVSSGTGGRSVGIQACSETQTTLQETSDNSLFMKTNFYAAVGVAGTITFVGEMNALNPAQYVGGFIIPTDKIHVGALTGVDWNGDLDIGFMFEVHTEKLSLQRIQELLVSLTAN
ncbi:MAG: hypothetical protein ABGY11_02750 [Candidatus Thioglobus sp.]|jgi:hypothetical protein